MPGKYSHLKSSMTKFHGELEYQERVNYMKDRIKSELRAGDYPVNPKTLGPIYAKARREKARLEALIKEQNLIIAALDQELVDMLEAQDFTQVRLNGGISLTIKDDVYCTVKDKQAFLTWIDEQGLTDLLSVNYQTMAAMVKTNLIAGEPVPPGIDTYFKQSITMRGAKDVEEG